MSTSANPGKPIVVQKTPKTVTAAKGMAMGLADVIPGVSGGTMALVLNIYPRLIAALKSITLAKLLAIVVAFIKRPFSLKGELGTALRAIDGMFLMCLAAGDAVAIVLASQFIPSFILHHTEATLGFFMGLIIPSVFVPFSHIKQHRANVYIALIFGVVVTVGVSLTMKTHGAVFSTQDQFTFSAIVMFASAMIAICAMILPGISGSFVLLLLGQYFFFFALLGKISTALLGKANKHAAQLSLVENFTITECILLVGIFGLGCAFGLVVMARFVNMALRKLPDITMGFLTGMVLGSLYVLWPFKGTPEDPAILALGRGKWLPMADNVWPEVTYRFWWALVAIIVGAGLSYAMVRQGMSKPANDPYRKVSERSRKKKPPLI